MKKTYLDKVSNYSLNELTKLVVSIETANTTSQRKMIEQASPFSDNINKSIDTYEELYFYCNLNLQEAVVTRRALIRDIDPDLVVTSKGKTNLELMKCGHPPYAFDGEDGVVELHHIGQNPDAPFAELTHREHIMYGNNKKLHKDSKDSWRNELGAESVFAKERAQYWRKRAKGMSRVAKDSYVL